MQRDIELQREADRRWITEILTRHGLEARATSDFLSLPPRRTKVYDLGILLVHGIGTQRSGETLTRWGDVIFKTIQRATCNKVDVSVGFAGTENGDGNKGPAEADIHLRSDGQEETWLLSEGWWADAFLAPSYVELVSWSTRALPWSIALHIAQKFWQATDAQGYFAKLGRRVGAAFELILALFFAPVFVVLLILALLLGLLPIPELRAWVLAVQGSLVGSVGDSLAFVESPIRAAMIRTRVLDGLEKLKERCRKTIIVAHSQGAAVVIDALGGIVEPVLMDGKTVERPNTTPSTKPDTLLTFGAGTNPLAILKVLSAKQAAMRGMNPVSYSMTLLFLGAGISLWIWVSQVSFHVTWQHMSPLLYGCAILGIFWATAKWLVSVLGRKWDIIKKHGADITACSVVLACIAAYVLVGVAVFRQPELPLQIVGFFVLIVVVLIAFIREIFSQDMKKEVTIVQKPSTLSRWIDLYSSADPVPSGRTLTKESKDATESVEISNMGSVFADHTAYWDNLDEFVLRVVKECAETANSPWKTDLPTGISNVKERAVWRVRCLRLARSTVFITWLSVAGIVAFRHGAVNMPFELLHGWVPGWLEAMAKRTPPVAFLEVLIVLAFFGTSALIRLPWRYWVHKEQTTLLEGKPPGASWFVPLAAMGIVVWSAVVFAYTTARVASHGLASVSAFRTEPDFLALVAANILFFAVASTLLLRRLLPTNHERKNSRLRLHYPQ